MRCRLCLLPFLVTLQIPQPLFAADAQPPLWGPGVENCAAFVQAWEEADGVVGEDAVQPYRDWLAGFVSGLNLATGEDVFRGQSLEAAMRRIHIYCDDHSAEDYFNASMAVIRMLRRGGTEASPPESGIFPLEND